MKRILVVTSCTCEKRFRPQNALVEADFKDPDRLKARERELLAFRLPAGEMYDGVHHVCVKEGVSLLTKARIPVDVGIVSAGYGLISECRMIVPYEITFNTMSGAHLAEVAQRLHIHDDLVKALPGYDLVFFLLGDKYLQAADLKDYSPKEGQSLVFVAGGAARRMIPSGPNVGFVKLTPKEAHKFHYSNIWLKGYLFKKLASAVALDPTLLDRLHADPGSIREILERFAVN